MFGIQVLQRDDIVSFFKDDQEEHLCKMVV